jgi:hypothetical protein
MPVDLRELLGIRYAVLGFLALCFAGTTAASCSSLKLAPPVELSCTNGADDDLDMLVDCGDLDCLMTPVCLRGGRESGP